MPPVLQLRIRDPLLFDPGSGIRIPESGWKKNLDQGSGMNIPELIFEKLASIFLCGSGSGTLSTLDPGSRMEKLGSRILDPG